MTAAASDSVNAGEFPYRRRDRWKFFWRMLLLVSLPVVALFLCILSICFLRSSKKEPDEQFEPRQFVESRQFAEVGRDRSAAPVAVDPKRICKPYRLSDLQDRLSPYSMPLQMDASPRRVSTMPQVSMPSMPSMPVSAPRLPMSNMMMQGPRTMRASSADALRPMSAMQLSPRNQDWHPNQYSLPQGSALRPGVYNRHTEIFPACDLPMHLGGQMHMGGPMHSGANGLIWTGSRPPTSGGFVPPTMAGSRPLATGGSVPPTIGGSVPPPIQWGRTGRAPKSTNEWFA